LARKNQISWRELSETEVKGGENKRKRAPNGESNTVPKGLVVENCETKG